MSFLSSTTQWLRFAASVLVVLCFLAPQQAHATHSMGLDLTYKSTNVANQYEVTLTFYRDCNGVNAPTTPTVNWMNTCASGSVQLTQTNMVEITPSCPGIVGTACNGGNGIFGIEEYTYTGLLTVAATPNCSDLILSFRQCCRNGAITTLTNPLSEQLYVEATIGNMAVANQSPIFTNKPVPFGCVGQPVFYNHGATDADGDDLVYSLTSCYSATNSPVTYGAGFSAANPLVTTNGVNIDASTGAITFTPSVEQVGVLCVLVEEYRNGALVGTIVRDIQFTSVACSNNVPTLSGVNNTTDFSAVAVAGTPLCFDVFSNDIDVNQTTTLNWNAAIAGAIFTSAGTPFAIGTFCWTPTANDVGVHTFTVNVADDYCPIVGQNTYTYTIEVEAPIVVNPPCAVAVAVASTTDLMCTNNDGTATIVATNGTAPYTYQVVNWTTNQFFTSTNGVFYDLTAGNYGVLVSDANGCTPDCSGTNFDIAGNVSPLVVVATATDVSCPTNSINTANNTNNDGTIIVNANGGTAPYLYSIDGTSFQQNETFVSLTAGTYAVVVMDANGCSEIITATVGEPNPIQITVVNSNSATCGQANGSITLAATGGDGNFLYYVNGQSQSSPTFTGLAAGTYTFSVCDTRYCLYDTTIVIDGVLGFAATATANNVTCSGDCDGTASVAITGNTTTAAISWSNGGTMPTITNLCAGTYTATITDANGCEVIVTTTVTEPDPINVSIVSTTDESCQSLGDGAAALSITGGTPAYIVSIANFTTGTTVSNTTFNNTLAFNNIAAGQYVVNVRDTVGCYQSCAASFTIQECTDTILSTRTTRLQSAAAIRTIAPDNTPSVRFFQVNPNPASSLVQATYETNQNKVGISILDVSGKMVYTKEGLNGKGSLEIAINQWASGTYFVVLRGADNKVIKTQKLVINK